MASQSATREKLISEGMRQLLAHGYEGIGIGPILAAVKVPKGSFYHFFKSKDDYVIAIIDAYEEKYRGIRTALFDDLSIGPLLRLNMYLELLEREIREEHPSGGCLYGVLAQTVTARDPAVRQRLSASYMDWEASIRALLLQAQAAGEIAADRDIADLAADLIDAYEGALIRVKATGNPSAFTRFRTSGIARLAKSIAATTA